MRPFVDEFSEVRGTYRFLVPPKIYDVPGKWGLFIVLLIFIDFSGQFQSDYKSVDECSVFVVRPMEMLWKIDGSYGCFSVLIFNYLFPFN